MKHAMWVILLCTTFGLSETAFAQELARIPFGERVGACFKRARFPEKMTELLQPKLVPGLKLGKPKCEGGLVFLQKYAVAFFCDFTDSMGQSYRVRVSVAPTEEYLEETEIHFSMPYERTITLIATTPPALKNYAMPSEWRTVSDPLGGAQNEVYFKSFKLLRDSQRFSEWRERIRNDIGYEYSVAIPYVLDFTSALSCIEF